MTDYARPVRGVTTPPDERAGVAWSEGYATALHDFGIRVTDDDIIRRITKNPHGSLMGRRQLSPFEHFEIRNALGYHFEDCPGEWDLQTEIVSTVVGRILARRPEREC